MIPALLVRDVKGIVDPVGARQERWDPIETPENPVLLEPADVAYLPDGRLDEVGRRSEQFVMGESAHQLELDRTRVEERARQALGSDRLTRAHSCEGRGSMSRCQ